MADLSLKPIPGCPGYLAGSDGSIWSAKQALGRGRMEHGDRSHLAKLTDAQARDILARLATGEKGSALASEYGVSACAVSAIKTGRVRRHLALVPPEEKTA
jgi:hypothetical protein